MGVLRDLAMQGPGCEEVLDPDQHFVHVERLGDEVRRSHRQRALARLGRVIPRQHQDGEILGCGHPGPEALHHGYAVDLGHVEVQQQDVGFDLSEPRNGNPWIGDGRDLPVARDSQHALQDLHVGWLVVDDQDARVGIAGGDHAVSSYGPNREPPGPFGPGIRA